MLQLKQGSNMNLLKSIVSNIFLHYIQCGKWQIYYTLPFLIFESIFRVCISVCCGIKFCPYSIEVFANNKTSNIYRGSNFHQSQPQMHLLTKAHSHYQNRQRYNKGYCVKNIKEYKLHCSNTNKTIIKWLLINRAYDKIQ